MYPNIDAERARNKMMVEQLAQALGVTRKIYYNWVKRDKRVQYKKPRKPCVYGVFSILSSAEIVQKTGEMTHI